LPEKHQRQLLFEILEFEKSLLSVNFTVLQVLKKFVIFPTSSLAKISVLIGDKNVDQEELSEMISRIFDHYSSELMEMKVNDKFKLCGLKNLSLEQILTLKLGKEDCTKLLNRFVTLDNQEVSLPFFLLLSKLKNSSLQPCFSTVFKFFKDVREKKSDNFDEILIDILINILSKSEYIDAVIKKDLVAITSLIAKTHPKRVPNFFNSFIDKISSKNEIVSTAVQDGLTMVSSLIPQFPEQETLIIQKLLEHHKINEDTLRVLKTVDFSKYDKKF